MLQYLLLLVLSTAIAQDCPYSFNNAPYSRTAYVTIKGLPTNLVYNPNTKDLLFTLIDLGTLQNDEEQTKMDQYVVKHGDSIKIDNVNGQAAAVDEANNRVYIGSDDGLHVLNSSNKATYYSFQGDDIVQLFKPAHDENILYAVIFPDNEVYRIDVQKNEKTKVPNVPCAFILAVDHLDNIYYECDSKYIKVLLKDFEEPIEFAGIAKNSARAVTVDNNGRVILATNDGLYHLRPDNLIPKKLMNLEYVPSGLAFDTNGDIYVATNGIVYKYSGGDCATHKV